MAKFTEEELIQLIDEYKEPSNRHEALILKLLGELQDTRKGNLKFRGYQINTLQQKLSTERKLRTQLQFQRNILFTAMKPTEYSFTFSSSVIEVAKKLLIKTGKEDEIKQAVETLLNLQKHLIDQKQRDEAVKAS